jgi:hypothetical protein
VVGLFGARPRTFSFRQGRRGARLLFLLCHNQTEQKQGELRC